MSLSINDNMQTNELRPSLNIRPFPKFNLPVIEGYFSIDRDRKYLDSLCNLKYLKVPHSINFNLNEGDKTYVDKLPSADEEQISHLLTFIIQHKTFVLSKHISPDFVCFRGLLRLLMSTPYEEREAWIVLATKFNGVIYLCAEETQQKKIEKLRRTDRDRKFIRYDITIARVLKCPFTHESCYHLTSFI